MTTGTAAREIERLVERLRTTPLRREVTPRVSEVELLEGLLPLLPDMQPELRIQDLACEADDLYLTLVAPAVASEVREGDYVYGGLQVVSGALEIEVAVRIHRVACRNGTLTDTAEGRRLVIPHRLEVGRPDPVPTWRVRLAEVVEQAFSGGTLDEETARFRRTLDELIASPYEYLLHLEAQGVIDAEEQAAIQRAFDREGDPSLYGFINAVTSVAHRLRDRRDWQRAAHLERLGGELLRGDHQPPIGAPVFA